jgi:hypothetical protein
MEARGARPYPFSMQTDVISTLGSNVRIMLWNHPRVNNSVSLECFQLKFRSECWNGRFACHSLGRQQPATVFAELPVTGDDASPALQEAYGLKTEVEHKTRWRPAEGISIARRCVPWLDRIPRHMKSERRSQENATSGVVLLLDKHLQEFRERKV